MDANVIRELQNGLNAAYINGSVAVNLACQHLYRIIRKRGRGLFRPQRTELLRCDQFQISVAFITMGGVTPLLQTLKELEEKGVKGQILTTNYLNFSEPRALEKLNGLKNITLKMYDVKPPEMVSHIEGIYFQERSNLSNRIGSSIGDKCSADDYCDGIRNRFLSKWWGAEEDCGRISYIWNSSMHCLAMIFSLKFIENVTIS